MILCFQLGDGAPQIEHQFVLWVQDAQRVALHPQRHAGKVQRVQCLLGLCLQACAHLSLPSASIVHSLRLQLSSTEQY